MNPKAAGCPGAGGTGAGSGFAGSPISPRSADTVSFASLAGGGKASPSIDLSGGGLDGSGNSSQVAANARGSGGLGEQAPSVGGGGSGGSGGGGSGAGTGGDPLASVDGAGGDGGGSLLGQLKTFASRMMGSGKDSPNGSVKLKKSAGDSANMDKYRPRRLASEAGVGSKNMDIWKMMNLCVQGETCKRNVNSYILTP